MILRRELYCKQVIGLGFHFKFMIIIIIFFFFLMKAPQLLSLPGKEGHFRTEPEFFLDEMPDGISGLLTWVQRAMLGFGCLRGSEEREKKK